MGDCGAECRQSPQSPNFPEAMVLKGRICFIFILCFAIFPLGLRAQAAAGFRVAGVVHDATGGVIPGAEVTLRQSNPTNAAPLTQQTDGQGSFQFIVPAANTYEVEVRVADFTIYRGKATVSADAPSANLDVTLVVNGSAETVEVTADALAAETTSTQLGETLESKKMEAVPLNGRSFTDLMAVQPGIVPVNTAQPGAVIMTGVASTPPSGDANPGNLSISGQRETSNGFRVNGSDVEEDVNMGTSIVPNLDAIDSFRVLTSNFDAEYGNSSGGQVLVTRRRARRRCMAGLRVPAQHGIRRAQLFFFGPRGLPAEPVRRHAGRYAFHKSVTLFGDYQGTRLTEGIDTGDISVPSLAERGGDFSQVPLTGSVNGDMLGGVAFARLGRDGDGGRALCAGVSHGQIPQSAWSAPANPAGLDSAAQCGRCGVCTAPRPRP
jgi:hypothetical protein